MEPFGFITFVTIQKQQEMTDKKEKVERLISTVERLIIKMAEVDDTCVRLCEDIEKRDLAIVGFVGDQGQVIMKAIAEFMDIPVSTTTGIVEKLVKKGYLAREFSPTDRRSIQIVLSNKGKETHQMMNKMRVTMANRMLDDLTDAEGERLIRLMEKVTLNLNKYVPTQ